MKRSKSVARLLALALAASPVAAAAQAYINGGVGEDEADAMRRRAHEFPLRVLFAAGPRNEFTAYVPVVIADARGNPVLTLPDAGPMLFVDLPDGKYTVVAHSQGITRSQQVSVARGRARDMVFHWPADTGPM